MIYDKEFPAFDDLKFDEAKHKYSIMGVDLPSVTTIMKPLSQANYDGIAEDVLDKAARRGTAVHNAIENFIEFGIMDIATEYAGYMHGFREWYQKQKPEPVVTEQKIYHKFLRYAGTVDFISRTESGLVKLTDFKATAAFNRTLCGVQLEAYYRALESFGIHIDEASILHLSKDGTFKEIPYYLNGTTQWSAFGACLTIHNYLLSNK